MTLKIFKRFAGDATLESMAGQSVRRHPKSRIGNGI